MPRSGAAVLQPGDVHVRFCASEECGGAALDALAAELSPDERSRADRFVFPRDRRDFTVAHAMLRRVLSSYHSIAPGAWQFDTEPGGKPALAGPLARESGLSFNLSHTTGLVACAVTRGDDVGVDVESLDRAAQARELAQRFFAPAEAEELGALEPDRCQQRFIEIWTLKEAYVKALGTGLATQLSQFAFLNAGGGFRFVPDDGRQAEAWRFWLLAPEPRSRLAVAVRSRSSREPQMQAWSWHPGLEASAAPDLVMPVLPVGSARS